MRVFERIDKCNEIVMRAVVKCTFRVSNCNVLYAHVASRALPCHFLSI